MHTVDRTLEVTAKEILLLCFESMHELPAPRRWISTRRDYLYMYRTRLFGQVAGLIRRTALDSYPIQDVVNN